MSVASKTRAKARSNSPTRLADRVERLLPGPIRRIVEEARGEDVLLFASGLAFYALVSLVPLAIFVLWVMSLVLGDDRVHQMARAIKSAAPANLDAGRVVERIAELGTTLGVPALITGLWPATSYGAGLRRSFERLSKGSKREMKGMWGRGVILVVLLPVFVLGSLIGSYAGTVMFGEGVAFRIIGVVFALVIGFVGTAVDVALIYRMFPVDRLSHRQILRGTLWSAVSISLLSLALTLFISLGADFEQHFATSGVAVLVLLGVWLFLANALLLVGFKIARAS